MIARIGAFVVMLIVGILLYAMSKSIPLAIIIALPAGYFTYKRSVRKYNLRAEILKTPFPENWRKLLQENVEFYQHLNEEQKIRFEKEIQVFLAEKRVTGIQTEIDDLTMVLVAASAVIPVFNFPEWEYEDLGEVLVYPTNFGFDFQMSDQQNVSGMVGHGGVMDKVMILSKPSLIAGFRSQNDNHNVGIHEFAHLVDKADGHIDGLPSAYLKPALMQPWIELMHEYIQEINAGRTDFNPYGGTKPEEFFAVASEYFFESPEEMKQKHPELYSFMTEIYQQENQHLFRSAMKDIFRPNGKQISGDALCPCKSSRKYKNCCLLRAKAYGIKH